MPGGIQDGVNAIAEQIQLTPEEAAARAAAADQAERDRADDGNFGGLFFIGFIILIFFIIPWLSSRGRGKKRSEEHTSELQSLMRISYAVFCLKKKNKK